MRTLQTELSALESELADPSNPLLQKEREEENVDPGELIRGLVDVRTRLEKIRKGKEGRARLVGAILEEDEHQKGDVAGKAAQEVPVSLEVKSPPKSELQNLVELDRRLGELEHVVGSSTTSLDEVSTQLLRALVLSPDERVFADIPHAYSVVAPSHATKQPTHHPYTTSSH